MYVDSAILVHSHNVADHQISHWVHIAAGGNNYYSVIAGTGSTNHFVEYAISPSQICMGWETQSMGRQHIYKSQGLVEEQKIEQKSLPISRILSSVKRGHHPWSSAKFTN